MRLQLIPFGGGFGEGREWVDGARSFLFFFFSLALLFFRQKKKSCQVPGGAERGSEKKVVLPGWVPRVCEVGTVE